MANTENGFEELADAEGQAGGELYDEGSHKIEEWDAEGAEHGSHSGDVAGGGIGKTQGKKSSPGFLIAAAAFGAFLLFAGYTILFKHHPAPPRPIESQDAPSQGGLETPPGLGNASLQKPVSPTVQPQVSQMYQGPSVPAMQQPAVQMALPSTVQTMNTPAVTVQPSPVQTLPATAPSSIPMPSQPAVQTPDAQGIPMPLQPAIQTSSAPGIASPPQQPVQQVQALVPVDEQPVPVANKAEILTILLSIDKKVDRLSDRVAALENALAKISGSGQAVRRNKNISPAKNRKLPDRKKAKPAVVVDRRTPQRKKTDISQPEPATTRQEGSDGQAMVLIDDSDAGRGKQEVADAAVSPATRQEAAPPQNQARHSCARDEGVSIRAIISGRIWVQFQDGTSANYTVGDRLQDGRTITRIDPASHQVYVDGVLWSC